MRKWFELLSTAWTSVATHKLRSFLTILGVVIGVAAVIALMSVGKGAEASIISNIESLGSNLLFVRPGFTMEAGVRSAIGSASTLTLEDAAAIREEVPGIAVVAPSQSASFQVISGGENVRSQITGITPEYQEAFNLLVIEGDFITQYEYERGVKVAVLGPNVRETLFGEDDAIGRTIRLGNSVFRVIGVLESKGASMIGSTDDAILLPLTALQQITPTQMRNSRGERLVSYIVISAVDKESASQVVADITALLQERHQIAVGAENDFTITSVEELISTISQAIGTMTLLLGAIAAISLLVGGIGVMNIMLVSVVERTKEIGIRKALGAQERDIWGQFLAEAAFLTFTGGVIGVAIGWGISAIISRLGPLNTAVTGDIVLLAVGVAVGVGLFFGFYPAWHASRLDPIVALRSE